MSTESMERVQPSNQEMRIMAYVNGNLLADCEDCGRPIPVELTRCDACEGNNYDTADEAGR